MSILLQKLTKHKERDLFSLKRDRNKIAKFTIFFSSKQKTRFWYLLAIISNRKQNICHLYKFQSNPLEIQLKFKSIIKNLIKFQILMVHRER